MRSATRRVSLGRAVPWSVRDKSRAPARCAAGPTPCLPARCVRSAAHRRSRRSRAQAEWTVRPAAASVPAGAIRRAYRKVCRPRRAQDRDSARRASRGAARSSARVRPPASAARRPTVCRLPAGAARRAAETTHRRARTAHRGANGRRAPWRRGANSARPSVSRRAASPPATAPVLCSRSHKPARQKSSRRAIRYGHGPSGSARRWRTASSSCRHRSSRAELRSGRLRPAAKYRRRRPDRHSALPDARLSAQAYRLARLPHQLVVPAKAGTHNHRVLRSAHRDYGFPLSRE
jgi:hypothetical protein